MSTAGRPVPARAGSGVQAYQVGYAGHSFAFHLTQQSGKQFTGKARPFVNEACVYLQQRRAGPDTGNGVTGGPDSTNGYERQTGVGPQEAQDFQ